MDKKNIFFLAAYVFLSFPALADRTVSSKLSFVATEPENQESSKLSFVSPENQESSKPNFDNSPLNKKIKKNQPEWSEEPKYRQFSKEKRDAMTGEITDESYGIDFYY